MRTMKEMQEDFWERVADKGVKPLDMRDPEEKAIFYHFMGITEEDAEKEYPYLFDGVNKLAATAPPKPAIHGFTDCFTPVSSPLGNGTGIRSSNEGKYVAEKEYIMLNMEVFDLNEPDVPLMVCNPYSAYSDEITGELTCYAEKMVQGSSTYRSRAMYTSYEGEELCRPVATVVDQVITESTEAVQKVDVYHPSKVFSPLTDPNIIICYNRTATPTEAADKSYPKVVITGETDKTLSIHLPFKGSIRMTDDWNIEGIRSNNFRMWIKVSSQTGSAEFNKEGVDLTKLFVVDETNKHRINWDFTQDNKYNAEDWRHTLLAHDVSNNVEVEFHCQITLAVSHVPKDGGKNGPAVPATVLITSKLDPIYTSAANIEIPYITLWWGCVGKDTKVEMADGGLKAISEIQQGDLILSTDRSKCRVTAVLMGEEEKMCCLETKGNYYLELTEDHPVLTKRGMVRARELNIEDLVSTKDGFREISKLYTKDYGHGKGTKVYNLKLDPPGTLYFSGIAAGDFDMQQRAMDYEVKKENFREPKEPSAGADELWRLSMKKANQNTRFGTSAENTPARPYYSCAFEQRPDYMTVPVKGLKEIRDVKNFTMEIWAFVSDSEDGTEAENMVCQKDSFIWGIKNGKQVFMLPGERAIEVPCEDMAGRWNQYFIRYTNGKLALGMNGSVRETTEIGSGRILQDADIVIGKGFLGYVHRFMLYDASIADSVLRARMFQNVYSSDMNHVVAFIDCSTKQICDLGPNMLVPGTSGVCGIVDLAGCYIPSLGTYACVQDSGDINPGGFNKGNFSIYIKAYLDPFQEGDAVLLSNGSFGGGEEVILYTRQEENKSLYLRMGNKDLIMAQKLPVEQWVDILVCYDATRGQVDAFINGEKTVSAEMEGFYRRSKGQVRIGNGLDQEGNDYTAPDAFSAVAIFDRPLDITHARRFFTGGPFLFEEGIRALFTFDGVAAELVSQKAVHVEASDVQVISGTVNNMNPIPYMYHIEIDVSKHSEEAGILYKRLKKEYQKVGLNLEGYNKEVQNALCCYLDRCLAKKGDYTEEAFAAGLYGTAYANNLYNRKESNTKDMLGNNLVMASWRAAAEAVKALKRKADGEV